VCVRDEENAKSWTPVLTALSELEAEKIGEDKERMQRRRRRQNREILDQAISRISKRELKKSLSSAAAALAPVNQPTQSVTADGPTPEEQWLHSNFEPEDETAWQERKRRKYEERRVRQATEWHCTHCWADSQRSPTRHPGPRGHSTLCHACWFIFSARSALPTHRRDLYRSLSVPTTTSVPQTGSNTRAVTPSEFDSTN